MKRSQTSVPTLDDVGWVTNGIREKLDWLLAMFFTTDAGQSSLYTGAIRSFQSIRADNINDVSIMASDMQSYIHNYLSAYFQNVDVTIEFCEPDKPIPTDLHAIESSTIGMILKVVVGDKDEFTQLEKPVSYQNGVFSYVLDKFNGG